MIVKLIAYLIQDLIVDLRANQSVDLIVYLTADLGVDLTLIAEMTALRHTIIRSTTSCVQPLLI